MSSLGHGMPYASRLTRSSGTCNCRSCGNTEPYSIGGPQTYTCVVDADSIAVLSTYSHKSQSSNIVALLSDTWRSIRPKVTEVHSPIASKTACALEGVPVST